MFVTNGIGVSLDGLRMVYIKHKGTVKEKGRLLYSDGVDLTVPADVAKAILAEASTSQTKEQGE